MAHGILGLAAALPFAADPLEITNATFYRHKLGLLVLVSFRDIVSAYGFIIFI